MSMTVSEGYPLSSAPRTLSLFLASSPPPISLPPQKSPNTPSLLLCESSARTPYGFSGGGLWRFAQSAPKQLFIPEQNIRLCGIQYAWQESERYAHIVPISCWVR